jgi:uncharacterized protein (UPF0332 family)
MKPHVVAHLRNAHERLQDAEAMLSLSRHAGTVDRTYYVMFEAASAMLASLGLEFDSHYGVKIKFGELLVKTGKAERKFGCYLSRAFELREDAVYALDTRAEIPLEAADQELRKATEFLTMAEQFLRGAGGKSE